MKRIVSFFLSVITSIALCATVEINGVYYKLTGDCAEVIGLKSSRIPSQWIDSLQIPSMITYETQNYVVTSIGDSAFLWHGYLEYVSLPNNLSKIGNYAFAHCENLKAISFGNNLLSIGYRAFEYCISLTEINIPNSVMFIGNGAFDHCQFIKSIQISEGLTNIGDSVFISCESLDYVSIPNKVEIIGNYAFENCGALSYVSMPNNVKKIGKYAFGYCRQLNEVNISNNVTELQDGAFYWCHALKFINIPESTIKIGNFAFSECTSLKTVKIPKNVSCIGPSAFSFCDSVVSYDVDTNNTHFTSSDGVLFNFTKDTLIQYPIYNTRIKYSIPDGVKCLCYCSFYRCKNLSEILMPTTVDNLVEGALYNCTNLGTITCLAIKPPSCGMGCFTYVDKTIPVYVPSQSVELYQNANEWRDFSNIQGISTSINEITNSSLSQYIKVVHNNQLLILRDGKTYNAQGGEL